MKSKANNSVTCRVELTKDAKDCLDRLLDRSCMTQTAVLSRLLEWFIKQPDYVQGAALGHYPKEIQADIAKMLLKIK